MATQQAVKIEGLDSVLKTLKELGPAAQKNGGPIRAALRKASLIMLDQVRANIRALVLEPNEGGLPSQSTGLLLSSVRASRKRPPNGQNGERLNIGIKKKAYPGTKGDVSTPQVARLLEYGTAKMRPHPFLRPAFDSRKREVLDSFSRELPNAIVALQKKLARKNGNKG